MAGVGHSTLLKFLHTSEITMSEQPTDSPIESQVPLQQLLRTANANTDTSDVRDDKHAENSKKPQIEETKFTTNDLTDKTKEGIDIVPERSLNVSKNDNLSADKYKTPVVDAVRDKENKDILIEYIKSLDKNPEDNLLTFENKEKDEVDTEVAKKNEDITKSENKNDNENSLSNDKTKTSNEDEGTNDNSTEEATAEAVGNVVYSPVITVIKEETTLTKGDLKMQRVVVSEDISDVTTVRKLTTAEQGEPGDAHSVIHSEVLAVAMRTDKQTGDGEQELTKGEHSKDLKKTQTKIPKLRLKQVVERIRKEKEEKLKQEENKIPTGKQLHSSIPKLKDVKTPPQKVDLPKIYDINTPLQNNQNNFIENKTSEDVESPRIDDEFDKIYEEIIENETLNNVPSPEKISDPIKLESKFEEIIHAYDENNVQPIVVEKPKSKIPLLKRRSEHDIVIPPPSDRKNLLKRSNTEDFKGKILVSVSKEILLKPNIETDKSNIDTTKTNVSNTCVHSDVLSTNSDESQSSNTIEVKTITKQMSVETNKVNITASTDNVVMKPVTTTNDVSYFETDKTENICTTKINEPNIGIHSDILSNKNVEKNKTSVKTVTTQTSIEIKKLEPGASANITKLENFDDVNKTCSRREIAVESLATIANADVSTHKTLDTNSNIYSNILSVKNVESLDSFDTSKIKTVTTQTSIEINKLDVIATSKKIVTKSEKTSDNLKDMTKCKIPVALNSKENRATKINSVTINKHPTKINITENIFNQTTSNKTEEGTDKKVQQSLPHSVTHEIKSATLLLQSDKLYKRESQIPGSPEIDKQIGTKQSYLLQESKTSENTKNVKAIENLIHDMPTIPRTITKYEKETDVAKKDVDVLQNISSPKKSEYNTIKSHSNVSQLKENKDYNVPAPKEIVSTTQSLIKKIDTGSMCVSTKANPIKITDIRVHPTQNENRYPTSPTSDNISNSKKIINKDTVVIKTKEKEIKAEQKSTNSIVKEPKFSVQYFRNKNETEDKPDDNKFEADINNKVKLNPETTVNDTKPQTDTRTIIDDKSQTESLYTETKNKWMKIASDSNHRPCDTQTPGTIPATKDLEKEKNIKSEDSSSISTNIEDKEEEDIILLKGKVSRVISRLDSKDHRTVKKEVDDLPTEVSVISKIALFERNESTDTVSKNELNITNSEAATQNVANDKPKVVNEILKTDINQNAVEQPETASVTDIPQNTANNLNSNKANVMETRRVFKTVNSINEGKPLRRTQSSFPAGENYVLAGKDDEPSCLEIWKEYRRQKELELELRRAWSLAELEGEETRGRVRRLAAQLSAGGERAGRSVDRAGGGVPGSVSQRIALYEVFLG
ncbi:uncharacterized protein LOC112054146 [Bicyclus anynana]|uniref:Uncharacterized protein LOC112054146 n=1 Tax=Bicyclus anynana TaxID=110368 RepID=A0ABM3M2X2_BICAN|nr:uncharacterized protein LOC112054146 [Bicyclus anynana]